jgi:hypothetical protein
MRLSLLILLGTIIGFRAISQDSPIVRGRVMPELTQPPRLLGEYSFEQRILFRFRDSVPNIEKYGFKILINKAGKAEKVEYSQNGELLQIASQDWKKITEFVKDSLRWMPAYELKAGKRKYFSSIQYYIVKEQK